MVFDLISIYSISFHIFPYQPKLQVLWLRPRHVRRVPGPAVEGLSFSFSFSVSCGTGGGTCLFTSPNYWTQNPQQIPWFCSQVMFEIPQTIWIFMEVRDCRLDLMERPMVSTNIADWWFQHLWQIWVRQLGLLFPINMESHNPFHGSSHHQPDKIYSKEWRVLKGRSLPKTTSEMLL